MSRTTNPPRRSQRGEPVWEIAEFFPDQGLWSEEEYFALTTRRLVEFDNGTIEVLPVPTKAHQLIIGFFYELIKSFIAGKGRVFMAGYRLRILGRKYREPDVLYLTAAQDAVAGEQFTDAAELVVEVVSPDDPDRDYRTKPADYAAAGVPEYWIVGSAEKRITVSKLDGGNYVEHGRFGPGEVASSRLLAGMTVPVDEVLAIGERKS